MSIKSTIKLLIVYMALYVLPMGAQSLEHPIIWTTEGDKAQILELVENHTWAQSVLTKLHSAVDAKVNIHLSNPAAILNTIPEIAADDNLSEAQATTNGSHSKLLNHASYAGMLYYLTSEEKYAQFAADILSHYIDILASRTPENTSICGNSFYDPRASYAQFAIAYDFIHPFLMKSDTKVYVKSSGGKVAFDNVKAQKAVHNIAMNALHEYGGTDKKYGKMVSNHPVLRAPGVLFSILCVEDNTERERMFDVFWNKGTKEQNSFTKTILPMFGEQGIWPEAVSYSFMQNITLVLNLVDRLKPEMNVLNGNMHILDGNFLFDNLRHPNRRFVRYGDSHRDNDGTGALYRYTLNLASRKGLDAYVQKAKVALRQSYDADGGYNPAVPISTFGNFLAFEQLFWGVDVPQTIDGEINFQKPTVVIKHAGVALQRNYVEENNEDYGLCGIIGGAHYVHSHCTGITMELYGANYIMAANAGLPRTLAQRKIPEHTDYFWRHAGNNTMIVNGKTHGIQTGAWNSNSDLWMNTTVNVAAEPKHLEDPINANFSFATQFLDDKVNNDQQQRTLSTIRTSKTSGYYLDVFRSKSLGVNNFHDYIYHNLGDETHMFNSAGEELSVSATTMYQNDIGDRHQSPGWRFFEDTKVTDPTDVAVRVRFDLNETDTYMNMFTPAGVHREFTKALGPATREARGGYIKKKTQIVAIRQQGEAWNKPFVAVFEPSENKNSSITGMRSLMVDDKIVGAVVQSTIGQKLVTDYIISNDVANETLELEEGMISFTGRFAIVRKEEQNETQRFSLYIGEGTQLSCYNETLVADEQKRGFKLVGELDTTYIKHDIEIEAEDFDLGGEGVAYHDSESSNYGTASDYREKVGVDISSSDFASSGFVVERVRPGEWLNYTFNVEKAGAYFLGILAANPSYSNAAIHAYLGDSLIVEDLMISRSGHWNIYETNESLNSFVLDSGEHTLRIAIKMADFRFDKIILRKDLQYNPVKRIKARADILKVSPNPNQGAFSIKLDTKENAQYKIYTLSGMVVKSDYFVSETNVQMNTNKSGVYILQVIADNLISTQKIIVNL